MSRAGAAVRSQVSDFDPLRLVYKGLTSVRFALGLIAFLAVVALIGVIVPQLPVEMRNNPVAVQAWLNLQRDRFGFADFLVTPMDRLGLFEVFRSIWFVGGLATLVASVCVCTANRLPPVWRNVFHPQARVPDDYYERGVVVPAVATADAGAFAAELRRRRYRVHTRDEDGIAYVFADRYPWAQLATFVSHLALILFLAGGLVTLISSKQAQVLVAEGEAGAAVFGLTDPDHMQIHVDDAVGKFDASGFPLDFRTYLTVYKDGREVAKGVTTVNHPLKYGGFSFHQAAFFPDGAALQVREVSTGRLVYDEVIPLTASATSPRLIVRDAAGSTLLDDAIVPTDFLQDTAGTTIAVPGTERRFWIGARPSSDNRGWQLVAFEVGVQDGARALLSESQSLDAGGISLTFAGMTSVPSAVASALPGADSQGIAELSGGPDGPLLTVGPVQGQALALSPNQPVRVGDYEYTFTGKREFAGLTVRRDPGSAFIWLATALLLLGLLLTFYTPRRRLWGRIADGKAAFRGLGGRSLAIQREIEETAARALAVRRPRNE